MIKILNYLRYVVLGILIATAGALHTFSVKENEDRIIKWICTPRYSSIGLGCTVGALFSYYVENKCRIAQVESHCHGKNECSLILNRTGNFFSRLGNSCALTIPVLILLSSVKSMNSIQKRPLGYR